jgi:hypothetical protein
MFSDQIYPSRGFSSSDLVLLSQIQARQTRYGAWGRVQLVQAGPSDFLAVWDFDADDSDPPTLVVARFKGTGTYALTRGDYVIATGRTLREIAAVFDGAAAAASAPSEGLLA